MYRCKGSEKSHRAKSVEFAEHGDASFQGRGVEHLSEEGRQVKELQEKLRNTELIFCAEKAREFYTIFIKKSRLFRGGSINQKQLHSPFPKNINTVRRDYFRSYSRRIVGDVPVPI
jgi:hypothetical protein